MKDEAGRRGQGRALWGGGRLYQEESQTINNSLYCPPMLWFRQMLPHPHRRIVVGPGAQPTKACSCRLGPRPNSGSPSLTGIISAENRKLGRGPTQLIHVESRP